MSRVGRDASKTVSKSNLRRPAHSYPKTRDEQDEYEIFNVRSHEEPEIKPEEPACKHEETVCKNGVQICTECGEHVYEEMDQDQEWRFYGDSDNKNTSDPSRCQYRKIQEKSIISELERLNFPSEIIGIANNYYLEVTKNEIRRGDLRKGIMFACVFEAYKDLDKPKTPDELMEIFEIDKKNMSKGLTYFTLRVKKTNKQYITAEHFIPKVLKQIEVKESCCLKAIIDIYRQVENKSSLLSRSNPQSVSCGVVFYYLKKQKPDISSAEFGKSVNLSEITINRISAEIDNILSESDHMSGSDQKV